MKQLISFAFLFSSLLSYSQGDQTLIKVPISATGTETAIIHLPDDYGKTTSNYPLMIFFHGTGEAVTPSAIYNSPTAGGPAYFISQGKFPSSFVNPADGKSYKFIVVSPQAPNPGVSTLASQADYILSFLYKLYRVDTSRVCLTGLSAGGECALEYTTGIQGSGLPFLKTHKIASLIIMSAVMNASQRTTMAQYIVSNKIGVWGFGSPTDTHGANTTGLTDWDINHEIQPGYALTTSYSGGHCCWGQFYDPNFSQNGMNIYQWALQYTTGPTVQPPPNKPPVANAGPSQTITLPANNVALDGSGSADSDGTIASYAWSKLSGPRGDSLSNPGTARIKVSFLQAGIYTYLLTITDNSGATSMAPVTITVNPAPACPAPRTAIGIQLMIGGQLITIPLAGAKIAYSDGSTQ